MGRLSRSGTIGPRRFIAVAGNMGSGKSTLVDFLSREYGFAPYYEPNEENPFLKDFYRDMKAWAFHSQIFFLAKKLRIHQALSNSEVPVIQDRTIYEDAEVFAENLYRQRKIAPREYRTYRDLYEGIVAELRPPNLMIYLRASLPVIQKRIALRGRPEEQAIPRAYLARLQTLYEAWFERYQLSETLVIETETLDYLEDLVDRIELFQRIEQALA